MKVETKVEEAIEPIIKELGYELEYVEFVKEGSDNVLRVIIDKVGDRLWVEDCETVSHAVEDTVDKLIDVEYTLEVSSPGLERQLKTMKLYKKYTGKEIHVKLFKKMDDLKEFEGILESVNEDEEKVIVKVEDKDVEINIKDIATAYTTYDFDAVLKGNTDNVNLNKLNKFNKKR